MPRPRGKTGTVAGLSSRRTDRLMKEALGRIHDQVGAGGIFRRNDVTQEMKSLSPRLTDAQAEGLTQAVDRLPGITQTRHYGGRVMPPEPDEFVRHRHWRSRLHRGDTKPARALLSLIRKHLTPPHLAPLAAEIEAALRLHADPGDTR